MHRFLAIALILTAAGCSESGPGTATPPAVASDATAPVPADSKGNDLSVAPPAAGTGLSDQ